MRRRRFLGMVGAAAATTALPGCGPVSPAEAWVATNPLRIPPQLNPIGYDAKNFAMTLQVGQSEFRPGKPVPSWGINGPLLGPTLRIRTGDTLVGSVTNTLPVDTTLHWHGMRLPADMDGGPHQLIVAGATWRPRWTVINDASTCWYHPHTHGATADHVFRGLAGLIIIDDEVSDALALPRTYGVDDLPCILQDRTVQPDGTVPFDTVPTFGQLGPDMLVNGTMSAYVDVRTGTVRLRLLNASSARLYHLGFTDGRTYALIANDSGLLPAPVVLSRISLGPGERAEIVVTLRPGEKAVLNTVAGDHDIDAGTYPILELRAAAQLEPGVAVPATLGGRPPIVPPADATVRTFRLNGHDAINGAEMDMERIDEVVPAGAVEIWRIENAVYAHNFHIHGVDFSVLDRDGAPSQAWEAGRKDTVHVSGKSTVRVAVQVGPYVDPQAAYLYHCHILRHEDDGMMGQYVVVKPGAEASTPRRLAHDQTPSSTVNAAGGHAGH